MRRVIIVDMVRTGITKSFRGKLRYTHPISLAKQCVNGLLNRNKSLAADFLSIDDLVLGCAFPEGAQGMNLGRNVAAVSKLGISVPGTTVNRYCASGLEAMAIAANQIKCGSANAIIAGGVESISKTLRHVNTVDLFNNEIKDSAPSIYMGMDTCSENINFVKNVFTSMGLTAEIIAEKYGISRIEQDKYSKSSQDRMSFAQESGYFNEEIIPINFGEGISEEKNYLIKDECNRPGTSLEDLSALKPAFKKDGSITAGNSSQVTDGAAMCLLMDEDSATLHGFEGIGYFHGYVTTGCLPEEMGVGPVNAIKKLLKTFRLSPDAIDLYEINEAFAACVIHCARELNIEQEKLNVNGGAISMGHPFGMTGVRMAGHIARELGRRNRRYGIVSACVGGGMGVAALIESIAT